MLMTLTTVLLSMTLPRGNTSPDHLQTLVTGWHQIQTLILVTGLQVFMKQEILVIEPQKWVTEVQLLCMTPHTGQTIQMAIGELELVKHCCP